MKSSDLITIVFRHGVTLTKTRERSTGETDMHKLPVWDCAYSDIDEDYTSVNDHEEGITWLRGHYMPDAPEVEAARTAQALGSQLPEKRETPKPKKGAQQLFANVLGAFAAELVHKIITEKKP